MRISIPDPSLIVLIGVAGSGKSAFAHRWFSPTSVVSSDFCRALISDDEENQSVSPDAFRLLHFIIGKRLKYNRLTVCDATNIDTRHRKRILSIRDTYTPDMPAFAIIFDLPLKQCIQQNKNRAERQVEEEVIVNQQHKLKRVLPTLFKQDFQQIIIFESSNQISQTRIMITRAV